VLKPDIYFTSWFVVLAINVRPVQQSITELAD